MSRGALVGDERVIRSPLGVDAPAKLGADEERRVSEREQLEQAIAAQERLRGVVDDAVIEVTVASLRERLAGLVEPVRRRRQATALFADVSGFTALASDLDAEIVSDAMDEVWSRIDAILLGHGAHIDKHIGDAVMALWGAEESHEGDPERAIRAALELQRALGEHRAASGLDLAMRIGINTGPVVFAEVGSTSEFTAMGDAVNVASRLEHAAPAGGILISHETYRHVRGLFDAVLQPPLRIRGKAEPMRVYVVRREKPRTFHMPTRGVEGVETRTVGRDAELATMRNAFESVLQRTGERVVVLVGDAGVGKSRVLDEFINWINVIPESVWYFRARAFATRRNAPHGVARDLLAGRFDIRDSDDTSTVADKLTAGFAPHLTADEALLVGSWLGFELDPTGGLRHLRGAASLASVCAAHLTHYLRAIAATAPIMVALEDLHWADDESVNALAYLTENLADIPLFVVGTTRPQITPRCAIWFERDGAGAVQTIALDPLSNEVARVLVGEVLHELHDVPDALVDLVVERADGNPYYVEELVKMLIDDGVIVTGEPGEPWSVELDRLDPGTVPPTLTGVLEARLDSLAGDSREALQRASVIGRVFWEHAVAALGSETTVSASAEALRVAAKRELIEPQVPPTLDAGTEYSFTHALLRDVTYETVLLRDRPALHALAANWLSANAGPRFGEFLDVIAEHLQLAGQPTAAADLYLKSATRSLDVGRSASARRSATRALTAWTDAGIDPPIGAWLLLADACCRIGDLDGADAALAQVTDDAEPGAEPSAVDRAGRLDWLILSSYVAAERGDRVRDRALLAQALPMAEEIGGVALIRVLYGQAWAASAQGDADEMERCAQRGLDLARAADLESFVVRGLTLLAVAALQLRDDLDETQRYAEAALAVARAIGDLDMQARSAGNLGVAHHLRGDALEAGSVADDEYRLAAEYYSEHLDLSRRLGMPGGIALAGSNLAQVCLRRHDIDSCAAHLTASIDLGRRLGALSILDFSLLVAAEWLMAVGDPDAALNLLARLRRDPSITANQRDEIDVVLRRGHEQYGIDPSGIEQRAASGDDDLDLIGLAARIHERLIAR